METAAEDPTRTEPEQPAPGAEPGSAGKSRPPAPTGQRAADAVAESADAIPEVQANALAYFMGEVPPPGRDDRVYLNVDFGTKARPNLQPCVFRTLAAEEFDKADELAQRKNPQGLVIGSDPFVRWSYVFAYACLDPDLGRALEHRRAQLMAVVNGTGSSDQQRAEADATLKRIGSDVSGLVREVFRWQPGVLQDTVTKIEERSRMGDEPNRSVVEVEAGKISS